LPSRKVKKWCRFIATDLPVARERARHRTTLFEARERLRHTAEELEAARAINRELMQQANRLRQAPGGPPTVKDDQP